jgi:predicted nucleic acid-binding protein
LISVVDSCVAVKWYAPEPDRAAARKLLGLPLIAPDQIRAEVASALWKKVRAREVERAQALRALSHLVRTVKFMPSEPLAEQALDLALDLGQSVYDCFFLALAQTLNFPFITADRKLWLRTRGTALGGRVIMLSDWEPSDD